MRQGDPIEVEANTTVVLALPDGATVELGPQTRFLTGRADAAETELELEAGMIRIDAGDVPHRGMLTVVLADLRFHLGPGRFFFEHLAGPAGVGKACAFAGTAALDSPRGAAGQLHDGQCVALERLGTSGPILLRSIARSVEPAPKAGSGALLSSPGATDPLTAKTVEPPAAVTRPLEAITAVTPAAPSARRSEDPSALERRKDRPATSSGTAPGSPRWIVNIASFSSPSEGEEVIDRLRQDGFKVLLREEQVQGRPSYRAVITGLQSETEAKAVVERLARDYGYRMAWALRSR